MKKKLKCALFFSLLLLLLAPAAPVAPVASAASAASAAPGEGQTLYVCNPVATDRLHLRRGPRAGADSLGRFYNGTVVTVLGTENGFFHVRIGTGDGAMEGYMSADFLRDTPVEPALPGAFVYGTSADGQLALRCQPDASAAAVATLRDGTVCDILGDIGEDWVYVRHEASDTYGCLPTREIVRLAPGCTAPYSGTSGCLYRADGSDEPIHLRAQPSSDARSLARYYAGTQLEVLAVEDSWALVRMHPGDPQGGWLYGYVRAGFVKENAFYPHQACYATLTQDAAVLQKGMASAPEIGTLRAGARVVPLALTDEYAYVVLSEEVGGYIPRAYLSLSMARSGNPDSRLFGAQGLCIVEMPGADERARLTAYATCDRYYPCPRVNSSGGYMAGFAQGDCLILLSELGEWAQVFDGYFASFVPSASLRILRTGDFTAPVSIVDAGVYTAGDTLPAGFYSYYFSDPDSRGLLRIEGDGFTREYTPQGPACYSFYLPEGARVHVGEGGYLTAMDLTYRDSPFSAGYASGRILAGANMSVDFFWVMADEEAEESYIVITTFAQDMSPEEPVRIPVPPRDENNNPRMTLFAPAGCFVEFVGCIFGVNG